MKPNNLTSYNPRVIHMLQQKINLLTECLQRKHETLHFTKLIPDRNIFVKRGSSRMVCDISYVEN